MRSGKGKFVFFLVLGIIIAAVVYTAAKDITPEQERVEANVEVKLTK